ncbi:DinB family protein [Solirubrum puertoriconensis]|uniref:DinB-like domain-containing protein n=1 Tax=Solirubrum puertoriconensis TaxID=1751427 RepID=A0A9X0HK59_SOLP1|nr:DinB family protein [Solirubrum puertoriconensis]KUG07296.1 hypothetical protein ASU33_13110 [Solirubrum puertoriconensis]
MNQAPNSLQAAFSQELKRELALTRRLLERVPDDKLEWAPHPKSMPIGKLAAHVAGLLGLLEISFSGPETDMATVQWPAAPTNNAEILSRFDENGEKIHQLLSTVDDATFNSPWTMRHGERVIANLPRTAVTRTMVLNHFIHHRGQLSVYLRLLDIPVPSIYGPSADER